jgi:hypothetical protein
MEFLLLGLEFFHGLFRADRGTEKRFEYGQKRVSFVESEGAVGHLESQFYQLSIPKLDSQRTAIDEPETTSYGLVASPAGG